MENRKEVFRELCEKEKSIPIFLTYGWVSSLVPDHQWDIIYECRGGEIIGFHLLYLVKKYIFSTISMPDLSPYQGIWLKYPDGQKLANKIGYEMEVYSSLIKKLPKFDHYYQAFNPSFTNWLPFYWKNFKQTTRYTYIIDELTCLKTIFNDFKENIRREIRKAERNLVITNGSDLQDLFSLKCKSYDEKGITFPINFAVLDRVFTYCINIKCSKVFYAHDNEGNLHAGIWIVWDREMVYYILGGADPNFKNSGAMSLLLWEAIKYSSGLGKKSFNFEGSMIEPIERFFRGFGAKQVPYFQISKNNSFLYTVSKELLRRLKRKGLWS